jgi:glycosyltransferase involved in cell wall biosynthesis
MTIFRPCRLIPTYNNPATLRQVVEKARSHLPSVIVVDDGSTDETAEVAKALGQEGLAQVHLRPKNGGKGAAVRTGFQLAEALNYTHVLQLDADDQHNTDDIPCFLEAAEQHTEALIVGHPVFDHTVPRSRLFGREITRFCVGIETRGRFTGDALCGFRVYPLGPAMASKSKADRMDFDIEILLRMVWRGVEIRTLPTRVRYIPKEEGGVSHVRYFRDNFSISLLHFRLVCLSIINYFR